MLTNLFFPHVAGVRVERLWRDGATIHLEVVATRRWARCPLCQRRSRRQHSQYTRTLSDGSRPPRPLAMVLLSGRDGHILERRERNLVLVGSARRPGAASPLSPLPAGGIGGAGNDIVVRNGIRMKREQQ
jgi:hypothetical protein